MLSSVEAQQQQPTLRDHPIAATRPHGTPIYLDGSDWVASHRNDDDQITPTTAKGVTNYTAEPGLLPEDRENITASYGFGLTRCAQTCDAAAQK